MTTNSPIALQHKERRDRQRLSTVSPIACQSVLTTARTATKDRQAKTTKNIRGRVVSLVNTGRHGVDFRRQKVSQSTQ